MLSGVSLADFWEDWYAEQGQMNSNIAVDPLVSDKSGNAWADWIPASNSPCKAENQTLRAHPIYSGQNVERATMGVWQDGEDPAAGGGGMGAVLGSSILRG